MFLKVDSRLKLVVLVLIGSVVDMSISYAQPGKPMVRLAIIEVDSTQIVPYNQLLKEEIQASILKEPGVITLYAVAEKAHPHKITLFETYADSAQYKSHLTTPHFQKYKQGTLQMVKHLDLVEGEAVMHFHKRQESSTSVKESFVRLFQLELHLSAIEKVHNPSELVSLTAIDKKSNVQVIYSVMEKWNHSRISVLEIYGDRATYDAHATTPVFFSFLADPKRVVKSTTMIEVNPILLGAKPK